MRILTLCPNPPWVKGGIERVIGETLKRVNRGSHYLEVYTISSENSNVCYWNNILFRIFKKDILLNFSSISLILYSKNNLSKFDLIHVHGYGTIFPLIATLFCDDKPIIFNSYYHMVSSNRIMALIKKIYDPTIGKFIFNRCKKIICISNSEKNIIIKKFKINKDKISIIPAGVDKANIESIQSYPKAIGENIILYVGRLEKYKNVDYLIMAMQYLPDNYNLYIIGNGPHRKSLVKLIDRNHLVDRVRFLGQIEDEEIFSWMHTCSVFVTLSDVESFGLTVIEALAAKKPVIVNNRFGLAELAEKFRGSVFPFNLEQSSFENLAYLIKSVCNMETNVNLEEFDWDMIAMQLEKIYSIET